MKYFSTFLLLSAVSAPWYAQHFKLSLNLTKGNTYYMVSTSNSAIVQQVNGQENKVNVRLSYRIAFKVTGVMDSVYDMEVRYQALNMKVELANKTIEMDSKKNDSQDISSSMIASMMNQPFNITMTKSGKIRSIKNIEKIINNVFDNFPQVTPASKEQIRNRFQQSFGTNAFKGNLELETAVFPEVEVAKYGKWTVNTKLESTFKANIRTVYQLTDIKGGFYQVHGSGTIVTDKNAKPGQINGMPVKYNIAGTSTVDIKVDKVTGWVSEVKLKQVMKGDAEISDNPKVPGGIKIPMTLTTDVITNDR